MLLIICIFDVYMSVSHFTFISMHCYKALKTRFVFPEGKAVLARQQMNGVKVFGKFRNREVQKLSVRGKNEIPLRNIS